MKTTLELPDELFRRAKALAAKRGVSLRQLVTEALEERLRGTRRSTRRPAWMSIAGGLPELRRESAAIAARIEEEFERVDEEDVD